MEWTPIVDCAYDCDISVGTVTDSGTVLVQLKDFEGNNLTTKGTVLIYLTTDSGGDTTTDINDITAPTHGIVYELLTDKVFMAVSEDDGHMDLYCEEAANVNVYVNIVLPNGKVVTSTILDFD